MINRKFIYLRRWKEDIKAKAVTAYFGDIDVKKITDNKYDKIQRLGMILELRENKFNLKYGSIKK